MSRPKNAVASLPDALIEDLERAAFYPELVAYSLAEELGDRTIKAHLVHVDTHFDFDDLHRHITVLVLADDVMGAVHLSDFALDPAQQHMQAQVSTEMIPMSKVGTVVITTVHADPQNYWPGASASEVTMSITWAGNHRFELVPAGCPNPECEIDHGSTGTLTPEDLVLRVAAEAEGQDAIDKALKFARAVRAANLDFHNR